MRYLDPVDQQHLPDVPQSIYRAAMLAEAKGYWDTERFGPIEHYVLTYFGQLYALMVDRDGVLDEEEYRFFARTMGISPVTHNFITEIVNRVISTIDYKEFFTAPPYFLQAIAAMDVAEPRVDSQYPHASEAVADIKFFAASIAAVDGHIHHKEDEALYNLAKTLDSLLIEQGLPVLRHGGEDVTVA